MSDTKLVEVGFVLNEPNSYIDNDMYDSNTGAYTHSAYAEYDLTLADYELLTDEKILGFKITLLEPMTLLMYGLVEINPEMGLGVKYNGGSWAEWSTIISEDPFLEFQRTFIHLYEDAETAGDPPPVIDGLAFSMSMGRESPIYSFGGILSMISKAELIIGGEEAILPFWSRYDSTEEYLAGEAV